MPRNSFPSSQPASRCWERWKILAIAHGEKKIKKAKRKITSSNFHVKKENNKKISYSVLSIENHTKTNSNITLELYIYIIWLNVYSSTLNCNIVYFCLFKPVCTLAKKKPQSTLKGACSWTVILAPLAKSQLWAAHGIDAVKRDHSLCLAAHAAAAVKCDHSHCYLDLIKP